ncbi:MAG: hypothetical protein ACREHC_01955, partial [Candidatus Levyibacteriota bacterium]
AQEMKDKLTAMENQQRFSLKKRELERKRRAMEIQMEALRAEIEAEEEEMEKAIASDKTSMDLSTSNKQTMAERRHADLTMDTILTNHTGKKK